MARRSGDAEQFREIRFESTHVEHVEGRMFRVAGDLTIRRRTRQISLATVVHRAGDGVWSTERADLSAHAVTPAPTSASHGRSA